MFWAKSAVVFTSCWAAIATGIVEAADPKDAVNALNNLTRASEFADHLETGIEVAQVVDRTQDVMKVTSGGVGSAVVKQTVEEVASHTVDQLADMTVKGTVENKMEDVVQDQFRDLVEDEIGDQVADSIRGKGRSVVRKKIR